MKKYVLGAALTLAAAFNVHAADAASPFKFLVGAGLTFGGDTLATVTLSNAFGDEDQDIKAGGLVHLYGGVEYRIGTQVSLQATVGYHVDNSSGSNASLRFSRVPVDLLAYYHVNEKFRLGGGMQIANGPELKGSGDFSDIRVEFDNSTGAVVEGEYLFSPHFGAKLRYVNHNYKVKNTNTEFDGSHVGLMLNYYF